MAKDMIHRALLHAAHCHFRLLVSIPLLLHRRLRKLVPRRTAKDSSSHPNHPPQTVHTILSQSYSATSTAPLISACCLNCTASAFAMPNLDSFNSIDLQLLHALWQRVRVGIWFLAPLVHALLRWHGVPALSLLLLLEIGLILQRLLVIGRHVWLLRCVPRHPALRHALWHGCGSGMGFLRRVDSRLTVHAIRVGGLGRIEAGLGTTLVGCGIASSRTVTHLDEVLAFRLGDQRLQLGCSEGVDKTGLRHHQQEHLSPREDGQLIGLLLTC